MHCSELPLYSIISSLRASNDVARGDLFGTAAERFRVGLRTRTPDVAICNFPSFRRAQVVRNRKSRIVFIKCSDHIDLKIALVCHLSKSYLTSKKAALLGMLDWFATTLNLRRHE
jgi:hypothetical protein